MMMPISTLHHVTGESVLGFLAQVHSDPLWTRECTPEFQKRLEGALQTNQGQRVECVHWDEIIQLLKDLWLREAWKVDPLAEYSCLVAEEQLLQHRLAEETLRLELAQRKLNILHHLDQIVLKASCLALSIQPAETPMGSLHVAHPTSGIKDFLQQIQTEPRGST